MERNGMSRRGFFMAAAASSLCAGASAGSVEGPIARKPPEGFKTGPLGKVVGDLPPGRYDTHIHIKGGEPQPDVLFASLKEAGLAGACVFSQAPYKLARAQAEPRKPSDAMDDCIAWASASPTIYPFYYINPAAPDALELVDMAVEKGFYGFKVIHADGGPICSEKTIPVYRRMAEHNKPVTFHTGILWDGCCSSESFHPVKWEPLVECPRLRFALCHISWPWCEECVALYGKMLNCIVKNGWENVPEMFIDTTPGTPLPYRREALRKLYTYGYDVFDRVMFGTDSFTHSYNVKWSRGVRAKDDSIYDELKLDERWRDSIYRTAFRRYMFGGGSRDIKIPTEDEMLRRADS